MFQTLEFKRVLLTGVCTALLISGCGGSSSGSSDGNNGSEETEGFAGSNATLKAGEFLATVTRVDTSVDSLMLLSTNGNFAIVFDYPDVEVMTFGTLTLTGNSIAGSGSEYVFNRSNADGEPERTRAMGDFAGNVISNEYALLETVGLDRKLEMIRVNGSSDRSLNSSDLEGIYTMNGSSSSTSIKITEKGVVEGSAGTCSFAGQVAIPDSNINIFEITYNASNCEDLEDGTATGLQRDGVYSGVGTFIPAAESVGMGDIQFAANNGKIALFFSGTDGL